MEYFLFIISFVLLIKASDKFVDASTLIAKALKISEIVIGATIVSIGTTLPELMVSATSALKGHGDIAYGNSIGSIICNGALISGISLIFAPTTVSKKALKIPCIFFFVSYIFYTLNAVFFGGFTRLSGIILLSLFFVYALYIIKTNKNDTKKMNKDLSSDMSNHKISSYIFILIVTAIIIGFASNLLVKNGIIIAKNLGIPESVIGITIIALGTSLPELSTAITSLMKGHANLSLGNIIGANLFNMILVSATAITLSPFKLPKSRLINGYNATIVVDLPVVLLVMLILCLPSLSKGKTCRWQGVLLLCIYVLFVIYQIS